MAHGYPGEPRDLSFRHWVRAGGVDRQPRGVREHAHANDHASRRWRRGCPSRCRRDTCCCSNMDGRPRCPSTCRRHRSVDPSSRFRIRWTSIRSRAGRPSRSHRPDSASPWKRARPGSSGSTEAGARQAALGGPDRSRRSRTLARRHSSRGHRASSRQPATVGRGSDSRCAPVLARARRLASPLWSPDGSVARATRLATVWTRALDDSSRRQCDLLARCCRSAALSCRRAGIPTVAVSSWRARARRAGTSPASRSPAALRAYLAGSPEDEVGGIVSPDGKWLAYQTNQMGNWALAVRPLEAPGPVMLVASNAYRPAWLDAATLLFDNGTDVFRVSMPADSLRPPDPAVVAGRSPRTIAARGADANGRVLVRGVMSRRPRPRSNGMTNSGPPSRRVNPCRRPSLREASSRIAPVA